MLWKPKRPPSSGVFVAPKIGSQLSEPLVTLACFHVEALQKLKGYKRHRSLVPATRTATLLTRDSQRYIVAYGCVLLAEDALLLVALRTCSCTRALSHEVKVKLFLHTSWRYRLWENERIDKLCLKLVSRYGWYFQAPTVFNALIGRLGEHQSRSEQFKEEKNFAPSLRLSRS